MKNGSSSNHVKFLLLGLVIGVVLVASAWAIVSKISSSSVTVTVTTSNTGYKSVCVYYGYTTSTYVTNWTTTQFLFQSRNEEVIVESSTTFTTTEGGVTTETLTIQSYQNQTVSVVSCSP